MADHEQNQVVLGDKRSYFPVSRTSQQQGPSAVRCRCIQPQNSGIDHMASAHRTGASNVDMLHMLSGCVVSSQQTMLLPQPDVPSEGRVRFLAIRVTEFIFLAIMIMEIVQPLGVLRRMSAFGRVRTKRRCGNSRKHAKPDPRDEVTTILPWPLMCRHRSSLCHREEWKDHRCGCMYHTQLEIQ